MLARGHTSRFLMIVPSFMMTSIDWTGAGLAGSVNQRSVAPSTVMSASGFPSITRMSARAPTSMVAVIPETERCGNDQFEPGHQKHQPKRGPEGKHGTVPGLGETVLVRECRHCVMSSDS